LFHFKYHHDYDACSEGDFSCEYFEQYIPIMEDSPANRVRNNKYIGVSTEKMHDMQNQFFDNHYNDYGEEVSCGDGIKGPAMAVAT